MGRQTLTKQLGSCSGKHHATIDVGHATRVIPLKSAKQTSRSRGEFLQYYLVDIPNSYRYRTFAALPRNIGTQDPKGHGILSFHEQEKYPTSSLYENCIDFKFQTDLNYYVELRPVNLALKLIFVKGCGYETYNTKEVKKKRKEETQAYEELGRSKRLEFPALFMYTTFCTRFSLMSRCKSTTSKITNHMDPMRISLASPEAPGRPSLKTIEFCTARGTPIKKFLMKVW